MANIFESSYIGPTGFPSADCTPPAFPAGAFADCPEAYVAHEGEIDMIWITNIVKDEVTGIYEAATLPSDHETLAGFDVSGIERLIGFGDKPLSEAITIPLPANGVFTKTRRHAFNFDFTDQPIANYELLRAIQGSQYLAFWYKSIDGDGFGGAGGIIARIVNAGNVHSRGEGALLTGTLILEWKHLFDPPRVILDAPAPMMAARVKAPEPLKSSNKPKASALEATV